MNKKNNRKMEWGISIAIIVLALVALFVFRGDLLNRNKNDKAALNSIEVTVINENEEYEKTYPIETDKKTLGDVLVEEEIIEYQDSDYGRFITAADGMRADDAKQQWWNVQVNGESSQTGIDGIEIKDGDKYTLTMMTGY